MKTLIFLFFALNSGGGAFADQWPYDPNCRSYNARSETITYTSHGKPWRTVLCVFGQSSAIDKGSLERSQAAWPTWAVEDYSKNRPFSEPCWRFGATRISAQTSQGQIIRICEWGDRSVMEEETFLHGPNSGWNTQLDWALGLSK